MKMQILWHTAQMEIKKLRMLWQTSAISEYADKIDQNIIAIQEVVNNSARQPLRRDQVYSIL